MIGSFTEKWTRDIVQEIVKDKGYYSIQGAICEEIALSKRSNADVVISKSDSVVQEPEDILPIIELTQDLNFFSSMKDKKELGKIIEKANQKSTYEEKAE